MDRVDVRLPYNYRSGMPITFQGMTLQLPAGFRAGDTVTLSIPRRGRGASAPRPRVQNNKRRKDNLRFLRGTALATQRAAYAVTDFHSPSGVYYGDYEKLESLHDYIQWLFPIHVASKFNPDQHALQLHEAQSIAADPTCQRHLLLNYRCFLDFIGFSLVNEATGALTRHAGAPARLRNLNAESHNKLRITRVLKCFGSCGLARLQAPLVEALIEEAYAQRTLVALRDSIAAYFVGAIKDSAERARLGSLVEAYEAYAAAPAFAAAPDGAPLALDHSTCDVGLLVDVWWHLEQVSLFYVPLTFRANPAHHLTRSPVHVI